MITPNDDTFTDDDFQSTDPAAELPRRLESLTLSHRDFAVRAAQELCRAERYRQYLSLIIVRGELLELSGPRGSSWDNDGILSDLVRLVRSDCRTSDLVSGVEAGEFAVLLMETGPEGVQQFLNRLEAMIGLFTAGYQRPSGHTALPVEVVTFPDQGNNVVSLGTSLETLYRRSNARS